MFAQPALVRQSRLLLSLRGVSLPRSPRMGIGSYRCQFRPAQIGLVKVCAYELRLTEVSLDKVRIAKIESA
jgi:hypothetical protein